MQQSTPLPLFTHLYFVLYINHVSSCSLRVINSWLSCGRRERHWYLVINSKQFNFCTILFANSTVMTRWLYASLGGYLRLFPLCSIIRISWNMPYFFWLPQVLLILMSLLDKHECSWIGSLTLLTVTLSIFNYYKYSRWLWLVLIILTLLTLVL